MQNYCKSRFKLTRYFSARVKRFAEICETSAVQKLEDEFIHEACIMYEAIEGIKFFWLESLAP